MLRVVRFRAVDRTIFEFIRSKQKTVETRAGSVKYQGIAKGDTLAFVCGKERFERKVKNVYYAKNAKGLLKKYSIKSIRPDLKTEKEFIQSYDAFPGYREKIEQFGILAFEV